ncbi:MAG TPA: hypothetical protein VKL40_17465 [Candidatus Angelobacter sp.]|nr:hypothetical protein [Candidatus Angelobacter sp.]
MNQDPHNGMRCSQFEALLADALEGADADAGAAPGQAGVPLLAQLPADLRQAFLAHRQDCAVCGPLFAEAQHGMLLLRSLSEVEPPKNLVHNILAATSLTETSAAGTAEGRQAGTLAQIQRWLRPAFAGLLHSRFATSFAMAFFSVSLTLSLAGVNFGEILKAIKHPGTIPRTVVLQYTQVEAKVTNYYENIRVVYEWESRVQQLKKSSAPQNGTTNDNKPEQQNQNRPVPSNRPGQEENSDSKQERYSEPAGVIAASILPSRGAHL